jgi:hypothetical protein
MFLLQLSILSHAMACELPGLYVAAASPKDLAKMVISVQ